MYIKTKIKLPNKIEQLKWFLFYVSLIRKINVIVFQVKITCVNIW